MRPNSFWSKHLISVRNRHYNCPIPRHGLDDRNFELTVGAPSFDEAITAALRCESPGGSSLLGHDGDALLRVAGRAVSACQQTPRLGAACGCAGARTECSTRASVRLLNGAFLD